MTETVRVQAGQHEGLITYNPETGFVMTAAREGGEYQALLDAFATTASQMAARSLAASRALVEAKDKGLEEGKWWLEHWGERYAEVPRGPVRTALAKIRGIRKLTEADFMEAE